MLRNQSPLLSSAIELMDKHIEQPLKITEIVDRIGTNTRTLEQRFRQYIGQSPRAFYQTLRLQKAKKMLLETTLPIASIAEATGFTSQSYFSKCFKDVFEFSPKHLRS